MDRAELSKYMAEMGRKGGTKAAKNMTKAARIARAKKAAATRHAKKGGKR